MAETIFLMGVLTASYAAYSIGKSFRVCANEFVDFHYTGPIPTDVVSP
ncbi:hypothetical protein BCF46_2656 [Litoreibacter meonggei]|uniref:Uncharacterized protein n=1 Tax=Litoreibacter meonggei TaxID=1049199 RepID=A0A497VUH5_9RHOB|nr:hypothetical protein BCF46_2656 [Litoreibacter meonggei]